MVLEILNAPGVSSHPSHRTAWSFHKREPNRVPLQSRPKTGGACPPEDRRIWVVPQIPSRLQRSAPQVLKEWHLSRSKYVYPDHGGQAAPVWKVTLYVGTLVARRARLASWSVLRSRLRNPVRFMLARRRNTGRMGDTAKWSVNFSSPGECSSKHT